MNFKRVSSSSNCIISQMLMLSKGKINIWYKICFSYSNATGSNTIASLLRSISGISIYKQGLTAHCTVRKLLAQRTYVTEHMALIEMFTSIIFVLESSSTLLLCIWLFLMALVKSLLMVRFT